MYPLHECINPCIHECIYSPTNASVQMYKCHFVRRSYTCMTMMNQNQSSQIRTFYPYTPHVSRLMIMRAYLRQTQTFVGLPHLLHSRLMITFVDIFPRSVYSTFLDFLSTLWMVINRKPIPSIYLFS